VVLNQVDPDNNDVYTYASYGTPEAASEKSESAHGANQGEDY
jgi:hypothetical protein